MYKLDEIIKAVENASATEKYGDWEERIKWLIEQAKEAEMFRMEKEIAREFQESKW